MLTINDIVERTGVSRNNIYRWISNGYLHGTKVGQKGKHGARLEFEEEEFERFLRSDNYYGKPYTLRGKSDAFQRVPVLEECYPYNLLKAVFVWNEDAEESTKPDIFSIDMRKFKLFISELTDREQRVIELRFQFGLTLDETAVVMGNKSRERIRQIQARAIKKLKFKIVKYGVDTVSKADYLDILRRNELLQKENEALWKELDDVKKGVSKPEPEPEEVNFDDVRIEELDLTIRSYNCLKRAQIDTLGDIFARDQSQGPGNEYAWLKIRNMGRRSVEDVARHVYQYCGYRLRNYDATNKEWVEIPIPEFDEEDNS